MTRVLGPERVPAGFTITTAACVAYMNADKAFPDGLDAQIAEALKRLEEHAARRWAIRRIGCWCRSAAVRASRCRG
jgi:pyruvate,orthophosphate dikinase